MNKQDDQKTERPEELDPKTGEESPDGESTESAASEGKSGDAGRSGMSDEDWKNLALKYKSDAEELKRLKAEISERDAGRAAGGNGNGEPPTGSQYQPPQPSQGVVDEARQREAQMRAIFEKVQQNAALGDENAQAILSMAYFQHQQSVNTLNELEFSRMAPAEQDLARRYYATGEYGNPKAALRAAKGDLADRERETLARQRKELDSEREARKSRDVVETNVRSVTAREASGLSQDGTMRLDRWSTAWDAAQARGDDKRLKELMALERSGKVVP